jgi:type IV secretion system protein VirB10
VKWKWKREIAQSPESAEFGVRGDRGRSWVSQVPSIHSRLSSMLALGLVLMMGTALLAWYYTHAALRPSRARGAARSALESAAQGEMSLPPLERAAVLRRPSMPGAEGTPIHAEPLALIGSANPDGASAGAAPEPVSPPVGREAKTETFAAKFNRTTAVRSGIDRRLSGPVYAVEVAGPSGDSAPTAPLTGPIASIAALGSQVRTDEQNAPASAGYASAHTVAGADSTLTALLRSEPAAAVQATVLTSQRLLLPKGAFIDCTLETAIDSTLPGMTTCVTATDTFGVDGKVVLLERGTKLVGETRGQVQQGSARVFVIWTEARTPTGVIVPLESPGTDQLGRSGLAGEVDRHFWDRFGAAILISTIDGAVQAAVESGTRTGATTIINPTSVPDVMTETLKSTLNIPPTIVKHNGDRIQILVARDIDFRGVYELRAAADAR